MIESALRALDRAEAARKALDKVEAVTIDAKTGAARIHPLVAVQQAALAEFVATWRHSLRLTVKRS